MLTIQQKVIALLTICLLNVAFYAFGGLLVVLTLAFSIPFAIKVLDG